MSIFEENNYTVIWSFKTTILSGIDERAADLRDDFVALIAMARQLYPQEFSCGEVSEHIDFAIYSVKFYFKVEDTTRTNMHTIVWDMMDRQMEKITGHNWKLKYSTKKNSCAFRRC